MKNFVLKARDEVIAEGVVFSNGRVALMWTSGAHAQSMIELGSAGMVDSIFRKRLNAQMVWTGDLIPDQQAPSA